MEWTLAVLIPIALGFIGILPLGLRGLWWGLAAGCAVLIILRISAKRRSERGGRVTHEFPVVLLAGSFGAFLVLGFAWPDLTRSPRRDLTGQAAVNSVFVEVDQDRRIIEQAGSATGLMYTPMETAAFDRQRDVLARALPVSVYGSVAQFYTFVHDILSQQPLLVGPDGQRNYTSLRTNAEYAEAALAKYLRSG